MAIKLLPTIGVLAGAAIFVVADPPLERYGSSSSGFALVTDVTLDGPPESIALGISLIGGSRITGVISLLAAMFLSSLPKALGGPVDVREGVGHSKKLALGIWMATTLLLAATVVVGYTIFSSLS